MCENETLYQGITKRFEPDVAHPSVECTEVALDSIAISLKRIADVMETTNAWGEQGAALIARAITEQIGRY